MWTHVVAASMRAAPLALDRDAALGPVAPGAGAPRGQLQRLEVAGERRHLDDGLADHPGLGVGQGGVGGVVGRQVLQEPGGGVEPEPPGRGSRRPAAPGERPRTPARTAAGGRGRPWARNLSAAEMLEMRLTAPSGAWSDARTRVAGSGIDPLAGAPHDDHRDAHHGRPAGRRWRAPRRASLAACTGSTTLASYASAVHPVSSGHPTSTWTQGAIAKPATFMVFDRKNRPTRPLSELSP